MLQFCREINKINPPPAFIAITGDIGHGLPQLDLYDEKPMGKKILQKLEVLKKIISCFLTMTSQK